MKEFVSNPLFSLTLTFLVYQGANFLYQRFKYVWLQPVLLTVLLLILFLSWTNIDYSKYMEGGRLIHFFLGPSVVALGVPLYLRLKELKHEAVPLVISLSFGSLVGIVSVVVPLLLLKLPRELIISMAPKSVTTPIAMGIVESAGGIPSFTAAMVVATGILGAVLGPSVLKMVAVVSGTPYGLALGAAAHGIGTAKALEQGELEGASAGLAMCIHGIFTALLTPLLLGIFLA